MSAQREQIDLAYRLLDLDLVDSEGIRCGKVDDVVIDGEPGGSAYVAAIRTGIGALGDRFTPKLRSVGRRVFRGDRTDIPSRYVEDFDSVMSLNTTAEDLGLASGDRMLGRIGRGDPE
jgi:sporulation protein YlmC with PRC-barrel domain